jgi:hypothetical protein
MPTLVISKKGCPSMVLGSGHFVTPWERMHWLNARMPTSSCCTSAEENRWSGPAGSRFWQAFAAAWYWEPLTPSCCAPGNFLLLDGSGKFGTPFERMHWAKASSEGPDDAPAFGEPLDPVDEGLLLHAAASRTSAVAAVLATAIRMRIGFMPAGLRPGR